MKLDELEIACCECEGEGTIECCECGQDTDCDRCDGFGMNPEKVDLIAWHAGLMMFYLEHRNQEIWRKQNQQRIDYEWYLREQPEVNFSIANYLLVELDPDNPEMAVPYVPDPNQKQMF